MKTLMGFPVIPFQLCDFWSVYEETEENGILRVRGELPGSKKTIAVALFRIGQHMPKGLWEAHSLEEVEPE